MSPSPSSRSPRTPTLSRRTGGFTLIELLTVISIMGILAAIAVPVFSSMQKASAEKGADAAKSSATSTATSSDVGGSFPWAIVLAVLGLLAVGAWLFLMAQVNKAKEAQAAAEASAPDADPVAQDATNGLSFTKDEVPVFDPLAKIPSASVGAESDQQPGDRAAAL